MKSIKPITAVLSILLLSGCAVLTTTKQRPTRAIRNETTADSTLGHRFDILTKANVSNPSVDIGLKRSFQTRETFQRSYIEKRRLKPAVRVALWATGAAIAGGGYYLRDQTGRSRLGELLMGAGGLIPLGGEIITASLPPVGEEWREESRVLSPQTELAVGVPVTVNALNSTWSDTTDEAGMVTVEVASRADSVPFGEPLEVQVTMLGEIGATEMFTVRSDLVNAWRTPPLVQFLQPIASIAEGEGEIALGVALSKRFHEKITVEYAVDDPSIHKRDINTRKARGKLSFPVGETSGTIRIPILDDALDEHDETIVVDLFSPSNATLGKDSTTAFVIIDNDPSPKINFRSGDFMGREGKNGDYFVEVVLSGTSGKEVSAVISLLGGTAVLGVDYEIQDIAPETADSTVSYQLIIPAGKQTISGLHLQCFTDSIYEGGETILLALSSPTNASLGPDSLATFTIIDGNPPPIIQFTGARSSGTEDITNINLPLYLSGPTAIEATVEYSISGTATAGGIDFALVEGFITIPAGSTTVEILGTIVDDNVQEGNETIILSLTNPVNSTLGNVVTHTYTIIDNETPAVIVEAPAETNTRSVTTIAILDFQGIGVSAQEAQVLTNRLATKMVALGTYQVIERGQMEQILEEQDFQLTGCTSNDCAVEIGQLIGAQQMLAGSFGKLGTVYTIDMKIIDVETGRILKTTSYDIEGSINRLLSEGLAEAVRRIAGVK